MLEAEIDILDFDKSFPIFQFVFLLKKMLLSVVTTIKCKMSIKGLTMDFTRSWLWYKCPDLVVGCNPGLYIRLFVWFSSKSVQCFKFCNFLLSRAMSFLTNLLLCCWCIVCQKYSGVDDISCVAAKPWGGGGGRPPRVNGGKSQIYTDAHI